MIKGDVLANRFEIDHLAGEGGMGTIYRAQDRQTGAPVALKLIAADDRGRTRFAREARALAELDHPAIVRYVAHGSSPAGEPFLAMEWLEGELLGERLQRGPLSVPEAVDLGRRVASALSHAHARGIVHRDLSPNNLILVGGRIEGVQILDFGLALLRGDTTATHTHAGTPMGTPGYMAPEQARGASDVDARADLFSLGCVLFEALSARPAFWAEHYLAVLAKIVLADAPDVQSLRSDVPTRLSTLIKRLLAKSPRDRPREASEVVEALIELGGSSPSVLVPSLASPALTRVERRVVSVVLAGDPRLPLASTLVLDVKGQRLQRFGSLGERFGAQAAPLPNGAVALALSGTGAATDQAARAVRCALAVRAESPGLPVAVATGWAVLQGELPIGEAIDRAVVMLDDPAARDGVRLDAVTSGLLPAGFEARGPADAPLVVGERDVEQARRLLGREVPCVGRERELRTLRALVDDAFEAPQAQAVLLTGAAGVGKSRVCHELLQALVERHPQVRVWVGRGDATRAGAPFAILGDALARMLGLSSSTAPWTALAGRVGRSVAEAKRERVAEFLAELLSLSGAPVPSPRLVAARNDPVLMADQIRSAFEDFLAAECEHAPVALVLEDFQWGDAATVKLLDAALRNLPEAPFFLLAVARPELHELFPRLWMDRGVQELKVGPLTRRASEALVKSALEDGVDDALVAEIVRRANGNAFFLEELVRAQAEGRTDAMPDTVLAMVQGRLEAMEPEARRVLRAASVFGGSAWLGGVAALLGGEATRDEVQSWLATLDAREVMSKVVDSRFADEPEYTFRHALVRDAAYAMLTSADRGLGHRLAATWLERAGESEAATLAEHYERGGAADQALPWWQRAAVGALDAGDFAAALRHADRGVGAGAQGEALGALLVTRAEALRLAGQLEAAEQSGREALELLAEGSPRWCAAAGERALVLQRLARAEELSSLAQALLGISVDDDASDNLAMARLRAAIALLRTGDLGLANQLANAATRPSVLAGPVTHAWSHAFLALSALLSGDRATFLEEAREARRHHLEVGDERPALEQAINMGSVFIELGRFEQAENMLTDALAASERLGLSHARAGALHNLGLAVARRGRSAEGLELERQALETFRTQDKRLEGGVRVSIALIALWAGDLGLAESEAERAGELLADAAPPMVPVALAVRAQSALARGQLELAVELSSEAMRLAAAVGVEFGGALVRLVYADSLEAGGREAEAKSAIAGAHALLLEQADELADPEMRKSFLENVPENRRTLDLATKWHLSGRA